MASANHSNESSEWYTPPEIVEPAREWLGGIDLDPASCEVANRTVNATAFYDASVNGLDQPWFGRIFLNPPSPPKPWWNKAIDEHLARRACAVCYVAYSIETLQQSQGWAAPMTAFSVCIPRKRIAYLTTPRSMIQTVRRRIAKRHGVELLEGTAVDGIASTIELKQLAMLRAKDPDELIRGPQPTHASAIVGIGDHDSFARAFASVGAVMRGTGRKAA